MAKDGKPQSSDNNGTSSDFQRVFRVGGKHEDSVSRYKHRIHLQDSVACKTILIRAEIGRTTVDNDSIEFSRGSSESRRQALLVYTGSINWLSLEYKRKLRETE